MALHKNKIRFSPEDDLQLLREVYGQNPSEDSRRWQIIQIHMLQITGKNISVRTLRDRVANLVKKFLANAEKNRYKSGIEEEVTELDDLLRQIADIIETFKKKTNITSEYQQGYTIREQAVTSLNNTSFISTTSEPEFLLQDEFLQEIHVTEDNNVNNADHSNINNNELSTQRKQPNSTEKENIHSVKGKWPQSNIAGPVKKRKNVGLRSNTLEFLSNKNDKFLEIRKRELSLQERQQDLEQKKFQLEEIKAKAQMEMEGVRFQAEMEIFRNQQKLLELVLTKMQPLS